MTSNVIKMPGISELPRTAPRGVRSHMDTLELTPKGVRAWKRPPFQRELRLNEKVKRVAEEIAENDGVVPGIITLGRFNGDTYLIDGQHRTEAFLLTELVTGYADVRICDFDSMAAMSEEFVHLNTALVRMRTDDIIRGLEAINPLIGSLRRRAPFVGYDGIRRGDQAKTLLSMAVAIRTWFGSINTPTNGPASTEAVKMLTEDSVAKLARFLAVCFEAWGRDKANYRLWSTLNLGILMWLWRRVVLGEGSGPKGTRRATELTAEQFQNCLMSLSADPKYSEWLIGRSMGDRDRSPAYSRIREVFSRRLAMQGSKSVRFPSDDWAKS
jgi:hypothetical protein